ncbi:hypothetical protein [Alicyclobacillus suci]|uniref:hypothetical protein n=1 Tax=Alicyclobacillus suci TaxID=2816080 RepID=UPI001A8C52A9|nr:hypothetical protein [Alicyclobacillus suci]
MSPVELLIQNSSELIRKGDRNASYSQGTRTDPKVGSGDRKQKSDEIGFQADRVVEEYHKTYLTSPKSSIENGVLENRVPMHSDEGFEQKCGPDAVNEPNCIYPTITLARVYRGKRSGVNTVFEAFGEPSEQAIRNFNRVFNDILDGWEKRNHSAST